MDTPTAGQELIEGPRGMFVKPSVEQMVYRLCAVVAWLATEHDMRNDGPETHPPHISSEEFVERTLYPEHFRMSSGNDTSATRHEHWPGQRRCDWCSLGNRVRVTDPYIDAPDGAILLFEDGTTRERVGEWWEPRT